MEVYPSQFGNFFSLSDEAFAGDFRIALIEKEELTNHRVHHLLFFLLLILETEIISSSTDKKGPLHENFVLASGHTAEKAWKNSKWAIFNFYCQIAKCSLNQFFC